MNSLARTNGNGQAMTNGQTLYQIDLRAHLTFQKWSRRHVHAFDVARWESESHPAWQAEQEAGAKYDAAVAAWHQATGEPWTVRIGPGETDVAQKLELWYRRHCPEGLEPQRYAETLPVRELEAV